MGERSRRGPRTVPGADGRNAPLRTVRKEPLDGEGRLRPGVTARGGAEREQARACRHRGGPFAPGHRGGPVGLRPRARHAPPLARLRRGGRRARRRPGLRPESHGASLATRRSARAPPREGHLARPPGRAAHHAQGESRHRLAVARGGRPAAGAGGRGPRPRRAAHLRSAAGSGDQPRRPRSLRRRARGQPRPRDGDRGGPARREGRARRSRTRARAGEGAARRTPRGNAPGAGAAPGLHALADRQPLRAAATGRRGIRAAHPRPARVGLGGPRRRSRRRATCRGGADAGREPLRRRVARTGRGVVAVRPLAGHPRGVPPGGPSRLRRSSGARRRAGRAAPERVARGHRGLHRGSGGASARAPDAGRAGLASRGRDRRARRRPLGRASGRRARSRGLARGRAARDAGVFPRGLGRRRHEGQPRPQQALPREPARAHRLAELRSPRRRQRLDGRDRGPAARACGRLAAAPRRSRTPRTADSRRPSTRASPRSRRRPRTSSRSTTTRSSRAAGSRRSSRT